MTQKPFAARNSASGCLRGIGFVTSYIQVLAKPRARGILGRQSRTSYASVTFYEKQYVVATFAAYLGIVLVTLARQHRSFLPLKIPRDHALVPSTVVLTIEGVVVAPNIARGLWDMEPLELLSASRGVRVGLVERYQFWLTIRTEPRCYEDTERQVCNVERRIFQVRHAS
jgi:hypothetical protein